MLVPGARRALTPHDRVFMPLFVGTVGLAWLALVAWDRSPYSRYLEHDWTRLGPAVRLCVALPTGGIAVSALLYVAGWVLMTAAMMLPTTLPLALVFRRLIGQRRDAPVLALLLLTGYVLIWVGFGLAAHIAGLGLIALMRRSVWLTFNGWLIGAVVLLLAGLFQFSSLKYRCLDGCRSPLAFVLSHWHGRRPLLESAYIGLAHGAYCVGCCWLLMLVMFVVGTGSVGWMLALGAVMAFEKNSPWGRQIAKPLGAGLISAAIGIAAVGLGAWSDGHP